jgi:hypothetical protein
VKNFSVIGTNFSMNHFSPSKAAHSRSLASQWSAFSDGA